MVTTELVIAATLILAVACLSGGARTETIHARVAGCETRRTIDGDARYLVSLEFELDGAHVSQSVIMDFAHYGRIRELAEVCLVPTVFGYEVRPCQ